MTAAKPDIPALADELKDMAAFYMERPCVPDGLPLALTDMSDRERKSVASMLLRATATITTAVEIGRAMQRETDAKVCDGVSGASAEAAGESLTRGDTKGRMVMFAQHLCAKGLATAIRSTQPLDLDALTERVKAVILECFSAEPDDLDPYVVGNADDAARAVLSALGILARED